MCTVLLYVLKKVLEDLKGNYIRLPLISTQTTVTQLGTYHTPEQRQFHYLLSQ